MMFAAFYLILIELFLFKFVLVEISILSSQAQQCVRFTPKRSEI